MNLDLSSILNAIGSQNSTIGDAVSAITQIGAQGQQTRTQMSEDIKKSGELQALEVQTSGLGDLKAQQNSRKAAVALGTNMDMSNEIVTALGMRMRDASMQALQTLDQIKAKESVGFFDNPIEFLSNQLSVGSDYDSYNLAVEEHNQAAAALQNVNTATQQTAVTQNAIAEKVTEASIAAKVERTRLLANTLADENKMKGFAENQDTLLRTVSLEGQQLQNHLAARQVYQDERNFAMRQQEFASSQRAQAIQLAKMEKDLAKAALEEQDQVMIAQAINVARTEIGLNKVEPREVNRILKLGGPVADDLRAQYLIGASSMVTGKAIIATNPAEALVVLNRNKGKLKSTQMNEFIKELPTAAEKTNPASFATMKPAEQAQLINTVAVKKANEAQGELRKGDATNIYALPPAETILNSGGLVKGDLYNKVLKPVLDGQQDKTLDPARVMELTAAAISAKDVRFETIAAELDTYFKVAKELNNDFNDYEQIGLPPQRAVNVRLNEGVMNNKVRDLSNPAQLRVYLMKKTSPTFRIQQGLIESGTLNNVIRIIGKFPANTGE